MDNPQSLKAKIAEVRYRKKLTKQHLGKAHQIPGEPDDKEIFEILLERINKSRVVFRNLAKKGITFSPFLEIGAEKAQRSLLLVNEFCSQGYGLDLSAESLLSAKNFARKLRFPKLPFLVCGNAYHLPFSNNSFSFVFCFETLHHFPDPGPIIKEAYRVLAPGGTFYFAEEPVKQNLNLNLWRRGYHLSPFEKTLKAIGLLPFLSRIGKNEVGEGILENEFSLVIWQKALDIFDRVIIKIKPVFFGPGSVIEKKGNHWQKPQNVTRLLIAIQGGSIEAICIKAGNIKQNIKPTVLCPNCQKKLVADYSCPSCRQKYRRKDGLLMLLSDRLKNKLYAD